MTRHTDELTHRIEMLSYLEAIIVGVGGVASRGAEEGPHTGFNNRTSKE